MKVWIRQWQWVERREERVWKDLETHVNTTDDCMLGVLAEQDLCVVMTLTNNIGNEEEEEEWIMSSVWEVLTFRYPWNIRG